MPHLVKAHICSRSCTNPGAGASALLPDRPSEGHYCLIILDYCCLPLCSVDDLCSVAWTGVLTRNFKHLAVDMFLTEEEGEKMLKVDCHFGKRKSLAAIRTCCSHVEASLPAGPQALQRGFQEPQSAATAWK